MRHACDGLWLALCLCVPSVAAALPLGEYRTPENDTLELYVAGSSAQDNSLQNLFRLMCEPNSLDVYRATGGNLRLLFCRTRTGPGSLPGFIPGQKVALHKSSIGGSGSGVGPLIQRTPVEFLNATDLRAHFEERCPADKRMARAAEGALGAYVESECANPTPAKEVPDAGISDVEPRFFLNSYHLAPEAVSDLSVHSASAFIFGIPVTLSLRNALQAAHFARTDPCHPENPRYNDLIGAGRGVRVARSESEGCMPSLSRAQLAGMFAGRLTSWSQIVDPQGYPLASRNPRTSQMSSAPGVLPPSDERVYVCRRVNTSGTQAAYEMFFLNQRCAVGIRPFIEAGNNVFLGSGSSDVQACMNELDQKNVWAVGILSTEAVESPKRDRWRFIKLDGFAPTLLNTFNGRWPLFVEQSYQWRGEHSEQPLQGPKLALMARIGTALGDPAVIRDLNRGFRHAWGSAGVVALSDATTAPPPRPAPGKPVDKAMLDETPIIAVRHDSNNCSAVVAVYPTALP